jgi:S-adenosylmethionine-diacylgycerolhomoserine-N-methlytransferase
MSDAALGHDATSAMDAMYRYQRHIYDLTRKFYLLGRDGMIDKLDARPGTSVLEIGCGTGRNLIQAAQAYPRARFLGVDVSNEMLISAETCIARAGLSERVCVAHADATAFDPAKQLGVSRFDRVFISYTLSMIPAWEQVVESALALLAPGGQLHIVDFGGQEDLPGWFRAVLRRWLTRFDVTPRDMMEAHLRRSAARHGLHLTMMRPFLGYAQHAILTDFGSEKKTAAPGISEAAA